MIGGQDEDSCGKSGNGETPQEHTRRGGSPSARGKRSLARKLMAVSQAVKFLYLACSSLAELISLCLNFFYYLCTSGS
ncbi:hypothetical protein H1W83_17950 [Priestia megaterium]|uniref:hypothetical protein n=1 Tax=Priestia megaterium TaxID=1404 RepID=UPI001EDB61AC|nr:hypothetical protein [Priestia megaterium]UKJ79088.1 hypothetical protein H1W83_17950 [Priestia megaterium]